MLENLHKEEFAECLDQPFRVGASDTAPFDLMLTEVIEQLHTASQETFSVMFRGPLDHFVPQGIHQLSNEKLGALEIFLVPVGRDERGYEYEAVFNHLGPSS